jgi:hypothetical protein
MLPAAHSNLIRSDGGAVMLKYGEKLMVSKAGKGKTEIFLFPGLSINLPVDSFSQGLLSGQF